MHASDGRGTTDRLLDAITEARQRSASAHRVLDAIEMGEWAADDATLVALGALVARAQTWARVAHRRKCNASFGVAHVEGTPDHEATMSDDRNRQTTSTPGGGTSARAGRAATRHPATDRNILKPLAGDSDEQVCPECGEPVAAPARGPMGRFHLVCAEGWRVDTRHLARDIRAAEDELAEAERRIGWRGGINYAARARGLRDEVEKLYERRRLRNEWVRA